MADPQVVNNVEAALAALHLGDFGLGDVERRGEIDLGYAGGAPGLKEPADYGSVYRAESVAARHIHLCLKAVDSE